MRKIFVNVNYGKPFIIKLMIVIRHKLENNLSNIKLKEMKKYLKKNYKISLEQLVNTVCSNFKISKYGNEYIIRLNKSVKINDTTYLESLVNLVDYGNTEIKGVNFFSSVIKEIEENINNYYRFLLMKGEL